MRFIRGHNSYGVDRSGPRGPHYVEKDRGYLTPCWIWQLKTTRSPRARGGGGYGVLTIKGRTRLAHRHYYEQANGPIPEGMQLDHLCEIRSCVNPDHLEPVTALENTRRSRSMKVTPAIGQEIERLAAQGLSSYKIAEIVGVSRQTIDLIRKHGADAPRRGR